MTRGQQFADNLSATMERLGVSRRELGRRLYPNDPETGRQTVKRHLKGLTVPNASTLDAYCEALGVEAIELLPDDSEDDRDVVEMVMDLKSRIRDLEKAVRP